jgi:hypothetical protein
MLQGILAAVAVDLFCEKREFNRSSIAEAAFGGVTLPPSTTSLVGISLP